jgi:hypothetical protein
MLCASVQYHKDFLAIESVDLLDRDLCKNNHKWLASASGLFNIVNISTGSS